MELSSRREDCWYKDVCAAEIDCNSCIRFQEMKFLMESSNLPKNKQRPILLDAPRCDVQAFMELADIKANIKDFVESGQNLYITSHNVGNGKTSWAVKILLKYFDEIWAGNGFNVRGIFIHVPTFLLKSKDFKNNDRDFEDLKKRLLDVDLVVWDDIGSTLITGYDYSQLLTMIDSRIFSEKSNIFTGNCDTIEILSDKVGEKLASRVWGRNTKVVIFKGGDQR